MSPWVGSCAADRSLHTHARTRARTDTDTHLKVWHIAELEGQVADLKLRTVVFLLLDKVASY